MAWDWVLQAVGFCVVGPQRGIREGEEGELTGLVLI